MSVLTRTYPTARMEAPGAPVVPGASSVILSRADPFFNIGSSKAVGVVLVLSVRQGRADGLHVTTASEMCQGEG